MSTIKWYHDDHGLNHDQKLFVEGYASEQREFFIHTTEMPAHLGHLNSALYGPDAGDEKIKPEEVYFDTRGDREGFSRMIRKPLRATNLVTIIGNYNPIKDIVIIYTAHGGPAAEDEPFNCTSAENYAKSLVFWADHALADGSK